MTPDDRTALALWDEWREKSEPDIEYEAFGLLDAHRDALKALEEAQAAFAFLLDNGEGIDSRVVDRAVAVIDKALADGRARLLEALNG